MYLWEPLLERMRPPGTGPSTGVNEAFSAPGCTQGLRAAALIRLLSPRRWLPGAGRRAQASGLGSVAPHQVCLVSKTTAHRDPVPWPRSDPWGHLPFPSLHVSSTETVAQSPRGSWKGPGPPTYTGPL